MEGEIRRAMCRLCRVSISAMSVRVKRQEKSGIYDFHIFADIVLCGLINVNRLDFQPETRLYLNHVNQFTRRLL